MNTSFRKSGAGLLVYRDGKRTGELRPSQAGAFVYIPQGSSDISGRVPYQSIEQAKASLAKEAAQ